MGTAVQYLAQILGALPSIIQMTQEVKDMITEAQNIAASGQDPTPEQWDALSAKIKALRGELHEGEADAT